MIKMEKRETIEFMNRIKSHYQEFIVDDFKIKEWHKELSKFDLEDVNEKLDEHLKNSEYGEYIPKLFFLTKYLIPSKDKGKIKHYVVKCQLCNCDVPDSEYDNHYRRCSGANTIVRDMKKYFNLTVDYQQLMLMKPIDFETTYHKYLVKMLESDKLELLREKIIMRCLYPNESEETLLDLLKGANKIS
jgi:hypothetical protein